MSLPLRVAIAEMKEKEDPNIIKKDIDFTDHPRRDAQIIADCISVIPQKGIAVEIIGFE